MIIGLLSDPSSMGQGCVVRMRGLPFQADHQDVANFLAGLNIVPCVVVVVSLSVFFFGKLVLSAVTFFSRPVTDSCSGLMLLGGELERRLRC